MSRLYLPDRYTRVEQKLLYAMDDLTGWQTPTNGAMEVDTSVQFNGHATTKWTVNSGATASNFNKTSVHNLYGIQNVGFHVFVPSTNTLTTSTSIIMFLNDGVALRNIKSLKFWIDVATPNIPDETAGQWFYVGADINEIGTPLSSTTITQLRLQVTRGANSNPFTCYVSDLIWNWRCQPQFIPIFDDSTAGQYSVAFDEWKSTGNYNIKSNIAYIDGGSRQISDAELQEIDADGWRILNHTQEISATLAELSQEDQIATISGCKSTLESIGLASGAKHLVYPGGIKNQEIVQSTITSGCISCVAAAESGSVNFYENSPLGSYRYAYSIARTTMDDGVSGDSEGVITNRLAAIDNAIKYGYTIVGMFHSCVESSPTGNQTSRASLQALGAAIRRRIDLGLIANPNYVDWFDNFDGKRIQS